MLESNALDLWVEAATWQHSRRRRMQQRKLQATRAQELARKWTPPESHENP